LESTNKLKLRKINLLYVYIMNLQMPTVPDTDSPTGVADFHGVKSISPTTLAAHNAQLNDVRRRFEEMDAAGPRLGKTKRGRTKRRRTKRRRTKRRRTKRRCTKRRRTKRRRTKRR
jgi:hypothetical protein